MGAGLCECIRKCVTTVFVLMFMSLHMSVCACVRTCMHVWVVSVCLCMFSCMCAEV